MNETSDRQPLLTWHHTESLVIIHDTLHIEMVDRVQLIPMRHIQTVHIDKHWANQSLGYWIVDLYLMHAVIRLYLYCHDGRMFERRLLDFWSSNQS